MAASNYIRSVWENEKDSTFYLSMRTVLDGTHGTANCFDYQWNIARTLPEKLPVSYMSSATSTQFTGGFIKNLSAPARLNLCRFWYKNPLMSELLWGLNKTSGTASPAIPNVDFAKNRDWEHCTLEDLMKWLKEDNEPA